MKKRKSFFRQTSILTDRYTHIFINDKQNLLLVMIIPLLTILIVCMVATPDMYAVVPRNMNSINNGYPVLMWENVKQEKLEDGKIKEIEIDKPTTKKWDGDYSGVFGQPQTIDDEEYYSIVDANQLAFLSNAKSSSNTREYLAYNYILQVDIDLDNKSWKTIGDSQYPFTGTFDGNGHSIKNLNVDSEDSNAGLFGVVESNESDGDKDNNQNGIVKNLKIKSANISTTNENCGVVAGKLRNKARVFNTCVLNGDVNADKGRVGGIVGFVEGSDVEIYLCYSRNTTVDSSGEYVGGLVGDLASSKLTGAYSASKVIGDNDDKFGSAVGNCSTAGNVKNVYFDNSINSIDDNYANGISKPELENASSIMMVEEPVKTAYEEANNEEVDSDESVYGFKRDAQLLEFGGTQTGLFMLVCVAIFVGICNSIQEICKERTILKREYMTNLRLGSYVLSKLIVQAVLCAIQMFLVVLIFFVFVKDKELPYSGAIFGSIWIEYFITMFLLCFASDSMALLISSVVKSSSTANTFIPIVLIVQIVFSGVLFEISGIMNNMSYLMISKWGISALAATSHINDAQPMFLIDNPAYQLQLGSSMSPVKEMYESSVSNLLFIWSIIVLFALICAVGCVVLLRRVKKDKR